MFIAEKNRSPSSQQSETVTQPHVVEEVTLKRDLGVFGSFSIGFADVGADIYVALGLVLFFAMGVAPLALAVAALGYIFTALSYAELASAIPMAGGASVFAREAFNDFWSFIAGWGLLLDYTIDIALFGWITMGYLGSFCQNLQQIGDAIYRCVIGHQQPERHRRERCAELHIPGARYDRYLHPAALPQLTSASGNRRTSILFYRS